MAELEMDGKYLWYLHLWKWKDVKHGTGTQRAQKFWFISMKKRGLVYDTNAHGTKEH